MNHKNKKLEKEVLNTLFKHYKNIILNNKDKIDSLNLPEKCSSQNLINLCEEVITNGDKYPNDKLQRWLGFTQGVLATVGIIDVNKEREFTRPYLHSYLTEKPVSFGE